MAYRTSIGLDVHARSVYACAYEHETAVVTQTSFTEASAAEIISWASNFKAPMRAVYETGPTGFTLARQLNSSGLECIVAATSKMLRPSGDRVKNDRRDALFLARMLATNNIPEVRIPTAEEEAAKDLVHIREEARANLTSAKLRLSHFLLRKGYVYDKSKTTWTSKYMTWLRSLKFETKLDKYVFEELIAEVMAAKDRKDRLQRLIEDESKSEKWSSLVGRLSCMKGISSYTAFAIAVEIGDFDRFPNAHAFEAYVGLSTKENSSGETQVRGGITKTGNKLVRKLLTEAAWKYMDKRMLNASIDAKDVPAHVVEHARKGCIRLKKKANHLRDKDKKGCVIATAIARELAGWVWAIATMK